MSVNNNFISPRTQFLSELNKLNTQDVNQLAKVATQCVQIIRSVGTSSPHAELQKWQYKEFRASIDTFKQGLPEALKAKVGKVLDNLSLFIKDEEKAFTKLEYSTEGHFNKDPLLKETLGFLGDDYLFWDKIPKDAEGLKIYQMHRKQVLG